MNVIKCDDLCVADGEVIIYLIADVHVGSAQCNLDKFKEVINEISKIKNAYIVLNGDLIDNALKDSISFEYDGLSPSSSMNIVIEILKPVAKKILCINSGNHELRTKKASDIDPNLFIATMLGVQDKYSPGASVLFVPLDNAPRKGVATLFTILCYHGAGGGARVGSKANKAEDMAKICQTDVYMMSHVHMPMVFKEDYLEIDKVHYNVRQRTKTFVVSNSFLDYGGYGEKKGMAPTSIAVPKVHLSCKRKQKNERESIDKIVYVEV